MQARRSGIKREQSALVARLRSEGKAWSEIAALFRARYRVNARVAFRLAHQLSQKDVADEWNSRWPDDNPKSLKNISYWEQWPSSTGHQPSLLVLERLAEIYQCSVADLVADLANYRHLDEANNARLPVLTYRPAGTQTKDKPVNASIMYEKDDDPTNRREFAATTALASLGAATSGLRDLENATSAPSRLIGREHVVSLEQATHDLVRIDAIRGSGHLYETAREIAELAQNWVTQGLYSPGVGEDLRSALAYLKAWIGWFAYDANLYDDAYRHYCDALVVARVINDPLLEARVFSYLSLYAARKSEPMDAAQLAMAAQRVSHGLATPRLDALFHLRAARGAAGMGSASTFTRELAIAKQRFNEGPHPDDPSLFIDALTSAEFKGVEATSWESMGKLNRAEVLYREVLDDSSPQYERNGTYYRVRLADVLLRQENVSDASSIALSVLPHLASIGSGRTVNDLAEFRRQIANFGNVAKAREFIERYDHTPRGDEAI